MLHRPCVTFQQATSDSDNTSVHRVYTQLLKALQQRLQRVFTALVWSAALISGVANSTHSMRLHTKDSNEMLQKSGNIFQTFLYKTIILLTYQQLDHF